VFGVHLIDRGYEDFGAKLAALGATVDGPAYERAGLRLAGGPLEAAR
jgi:hypothetical protein